MTRECDFCHIDGLQERMIRDDRDSLVFSVLSNPSLTPFHALVIPRRHVDPAEDVLTEREVVDEAFEKDRLRELFMKMGFKGVDFFQKNRPWVTEEKNGKMNHYHTHVFPSDPGTFIYDCGIPWGHGKRVTLTSETIEKQLADIRRAEHQPEHAYGN